MVMVLERQTRSQWRRACVLIDNLEGRNAWGIGLLGKDAMRRLELGSLGRCGCGLFRFADRESSSFFSCCPTLAGMQQKLVECVSRACHEEQCSLKTQG
jgi:hypothetical protein